MIRHDPESRTERDPAGIRESRVTALRDLVMQRVYDVPAEDVAARIIHDALVVTMPAPAQQH